MTTPNPWKTLSTKIVYKNPWIQVREDAVITPMGTDGIYGFLESKDSVIIAALNDKQEIYLIKGYSYPTKSWGWQLPGGGGDGEEAIVASKRELAEETGIVADKWTLLGKTTVCNGLLTEVMTTFLAEDITFGEQLSADDHGLIDGGQFFSFKQVHDMVRSGELSDGQTITGLYLAEQQINQS
jgi:8-oxo-dGTP pyrophosphatase MutT (NUDIX family)